MSAATPGSHGNEGMNSDGRAGGESESGNESQSQSQRQSGGAGEAGASSTSEGESPTTQIIRTETQRSQSQSDGNGVNVESPRVATAPHGVFTAPSAASSARKYEMSADTGIGMGSSGDNMEPPELDEYSEDDTEVSSEAIVDDIELILMPEEVEDLPEADHSPKLVRVTELNTSQDYDDGGDDEFLKMDEEFTDPGQDVDVDLDVEVGVGIEVDVEDEPHSQDYDEEDESTAGNTNNDNGNGQSIRQRRASTSSGKVHSGVQTDISALEKDDMDDDDDDEACFSERADTSERFDWRRRKTMTLTGVGLGASGGLGSRTNSSGGGGAGSGRLVTPRGKKLNWKSELTLLPSKTKIGFGACSSGLGGGMGLGMDGSAGFGSFNYANAGYSGTYNYSGESNYPAEQYSARVAKFTSQDNVMSSSSQFLKPSTLYRTRNLSRNLNHFASSETTFMQDQESPRYRVSNTTLSSASCANFKGSSSQSSNQIFATTLVPNSGASTFSRRRGPSAKKHFRQSLPDLTSPIYYQDKDNICSGSSSSRVRRQSSQVASGRLKNPSQQQQSHMSSSAGFRLQKKSSSDDETSSLIDESERCLRSSIDLLLTDDYPSPGCDYPYLPRSGAGGYQTSHTSGYYSARRSCSQPLLTDAGYCGEPRDIMGSPFLPRKLSDMRCSRWCKVILPNGLVAVVSVKEMDEFRDCLTVHTETGCIVTLPFRKVVFAWRVKR